jgi:hypothetical protein
LLLNLEILKQLLHVFAVERELTGDLDRDGVHAGKIALSIHP